MHDIGCDFEQWHDEKIAHQKIPVRNASMVNIVGPLMQFANALPNYTKKTRSISVSAIKLRSALIRSNEPIELLFDTLPRALHMEPFVENKVPGENQVK